MRTHRKRVKIEHTVPPVGARFSHTYDGNSYTMEVVGVVGGVGYRVRSTVYKTPTAAARSVCRHDTNGWKFWHID
jgi:hypothetical protein